jgi:serine/threonine protein kinase
MQKSSVRNYELQKLIGEGSYGKVYRALRKADGKIVAIKTVNITRMDRVGIQSALNEIRILNSVNSDNIVGYFEAFLDSSETHLWVVMEFVGGGDLACAIRLAKKEKKSFPERVIWIYMIQALRGLAALNRMKIIHRDIKPANIFISDDMKTIKLGDLNVSKVAKNDLTRTQIGTPSYLAPEVWENRPYDARCDIFSLGCCVYEMTALRLPFDARSMDELRKKIKAGTYSSLPSNYSEGLKSIINKCLTKNPSLRPSADTLLTHPLIALKVQEYGIEEFEEQNCKLMDSILLPKNLSALNSKLPKKQGDAKRSNSVRILRPVEFDDAPKPVIPQSQKVIKTDINKVIEDLVGNMKVIDGSSKYQSNKSNANDSYRNVNLKIKDAMHIEKPNGENPFAKKKEDNISNFGSSNPRVQVIVESSDVRNDLINNLLEGMNKNKPPMKSDRNNDILGKLNPNSVQKAEPGRLSDVGVRSSFDERSEGMRYSDIYGVRNNYMSNATPNSRQEIAQNKDQYLSYQGNANPPSVISYNSNANAGSNRKLPPSPMAKKSPPLKPGQNAMVAKPPLIKMHSAEEKNNVNSSNPRPLSRNNSIDKINRPVQSASNQKPLSRNNSIDRINRPSSGGVNVEVPNRNGSARNSVDRNIRSRNNSIDKRPSSRDISVDKGKLPSWDSSKKVIYPVGSAKKIDPILPIAKPDPNESQRSIKRPPNKIKDLQVNQSNRDIKRPPLKSPVNDQQPLQHSPIEHEPVSSDRINRNESRERVLKFDDFIKNFESKRNSISRGEGGQQKAVATPSHGSMKRVSSVKTRK